MKRYIIKFSVISIFTILIFSFQLSAQLNGTYTIGSSGTYKTFAAAVTALSAGINGAVVFNVQNGTYTENITITAINGASDVNTITFQSASGDSSKVILTNTTSNPTVTLSGASYITFSKLTIKTTGSGIDIKYLKGSNYNKFLNCQLIGYVSSSTAWTYSVVYSPAESGFQNNYNEFRNNYILNGSRGIYLDTYNTNDTGPNSIGTKFINNKIIGFGSYGIYLSYHESVEISSNTITTSVNASHNNIYLNYCSNSTKVKYNIIYFTAGYGYGIYFNQCHALSTDPSEVYNNFIMISGSTGNGVGIELNYNQNTKVYHNNFLSTYTGSITSILGCMYIDGAGPSSPSTQGHYDIQNNNFINKGGAYAISVNTLGSIDIINNNNYYSSTVNGKFGHILSKDYADFSSFTTALNDAKAYNFDPQYKSNTDLHIQNTALRGKGANLLTYVSDDIDNETRPNSPTIGADEIGNVVPPADPNPPSSLTAAIGDPANGLNHHILLNWSNVTGANLYKIEYSTDNMQWQTLYSGSALTYNHDCGDKPNAPYYYRASASANAGASYGTTKNCTQFPIYTACDYPNLTVVSTTSTTANLSLDLEAPVANPDYTTYSIGCSTTSQYVDVNGALGAIENYYTKAQWGNIIVKNLTKETQYCFYAKAKNMDGDIRYIPLSTVIYKAETFTNSNNFVAGTSGSTSKFFGSGSYVPYQGSMSVQYNLGFNSSKGCTGGAVGYEDVNSWWGGFLRTPSINCSNQSAVVLTFDLTVSQKSDAYASFYLWDNGNSSYKRPVISVKVNGIESQTAIPDGNGGQGFFFTDALNCAHIEVSFDLATVVDKTNPLFYINISSYCAYNNTNVFKSWIDNVGFSTNGTQAVCGTTLKDCTQPTISLIGGGQTMCEGLPIDINATFSGTAPLSFQWKKNDININGATNSQFSILRRRFIYVCDYEQLRYCGKFKSC